VENPTFKSEKIELLVCIYEVLGELVFKYGISGYSRCRTLETIMNPLPSQIQPVTVIPKPSKPCVTLQAKCERCIADPESKVVIKSYIWKMTKQWRLYVHLYSIHYTKNLNMPEN